jgi:hypothetical protein
MAKNWGFGWVLNWILEFGLLGESSEKGSTRKSTGNRVTRWEIMFLGESWGLRCFTKRNGFGIWGTTDFWGFGRGST